MSDDLAAVLEGHSVSVAAILRALRVVVRRELVGATERLDLPDHLLAYGRGPVSGVRMRAMLVALIPHSAHVNVQLAAGAVLDDPTGIIEGTGKLIRHVKCRSMSDVERPALRDIIVAQGATRTA